VVVTLHREERGSGEPILFIHGLGASLFSWRHLVPALGENARLILLDLKGFGKSPKPADGEYSIYDQARLVHNFIVEGNLTNLTLVGHSYGGGVALVTSLSLLAETPPRLRRLVLIDSVGYKQPLPFFVKLLRTPLLGRSVVAAVPRKLQVLSILKLAYHDDAKITPAAVEAYAQPLDSPGGRQALRETAKSMIPPDMDVLTRQYGRITVPTFILWGKQDRIVPLSVGMRLKQDIPNSTLRVIEQCGHIPHEEQPEKALAEIQAFLAS
jgi:pimeloyl-ACP methyl ester carboxylesterase